MVAFSVSFEAVANPLILAIHLVAALAVCGSIRVVDRGRSRKRVVHQAADELGERQVVGALTAPLHGVLLAPISVGVKSSIEAVDECARHSEISRATGNTESVVHAGNFAIGVRIKRLNARALGLVVHD